MVGLRFSVHVKGEVKRSPFGSVQELQGQISGKRDPCKSEVLAPEGLPHQPRISAFPLFQNASFQATSFSCKVTTQEDTQGPPWTSS
jgi:hypothetical protein